MKTPCLSVSRRITGAPSRAHFLTRLWLAAIAVGLSSGAARLHAEASPEPETFTYKKVGSLEIKADVFRARSFTGKRPVMVWLHGGALMGGTRKLEFTDEQHRWAWRLHEQHGIVIVSIDYRLAPETKLPAIIEDLEDAFRWVRERGPELFQADPARIAVVGRSAGGYLALMSGFRVQPRPVAVVSHWGYGDLIGPWYSEPSPHARHQQVKVTEEEAWRDFTGPPVANMSDRKSSQRVLYQYCRQHGLWPKVVSGWDPHTEAEKFTPYIPLKNVTRDYPPTFLLHGEKDTDVPCEQSELMAAELKRHGVEHRFVRVAGAEHTLAGIEQDKVREAMQDIPAFLLKHFGLGGGNRP